MDVNKQLSDFTQSIGSETVALDPMVLYIVGGISIAVFAVFSIIIVYHWISYSYSPETVAKATKLYVLGSGLIIAAMIFSSLSYLTSL